MAFVAPQGNKTVMVDNSNNIVYPASFQKVVATQATIAGNNFTSVPSVIDPENATTTQLPSVASVVNYVANVVEGGSSGLIPAIQSDIQTLGQVKSNRDELWFNGGKLTCSQKWKTNEPFSLIFTLKRPLAVYGGTEASNRKDAIYTCINRSQDRGFTLSMDDKFVGFYYHWSASDGSSKYFSRALNVQKYFDDKPHVWAYVFSGSVATLKIDGITIGTNAVEDIAETINTYPLTFEFPIGSVIVSRAKVFNFDITSADAPFTIADYIGGKDESPFLQNGNMAIYNGEDFAYSPRSNAYACDIEKNGDEVLLTNTVDITTNYVWLTTPTNSINIKAGSLVECSFDSLYGNTKELSLRFRHTSSDSNLYTANVTNNVKSISFTAPRDFNYLHILVLYNQSSIPSGTTLGFTGLKIKVNGALLSLDDYSIKVGATRIVPDVSGNNNDATITGVVYGSKDNSIAKMAQLFYQSQQG